MTVTAIEYTADGSAASVYLDGEPAALLSADDIFELGVFVGAEPDSELLDSIRRRGDARFALEKAMRTIDAMDVTKAKLAQRLREKGVSPELAEATAAFCEEKGYIDDRAYAFYNTQYCAETKRFGARRIEQELLRRGVPRELAREALEANYPDEPASIRWWLGSKFSGRDLAERRERQRVTDFLLRTGFSYGDIREALNEAAEDAAEEE